MGYESKGDTGLLRRLKPVRFLVKEYVGITIRMEKGNRRRGRLFRCWDFIRRIGDIPRIWRGNPVVYRPFAEFHHLRSRVFDRRSVFARLDEKKKNQQGDGIK